MLNRARAKSLKIKDDVFFFFWVKKREVWSVQNLKEKKNFLYEF
jgi:hypothetical protein